MNFQLLSSDLDSFKVSLHILESLTLNMSSKVVLESSLSQLAGREKGPRESHLKFFYKSGMEVVYNTCTGISLAITQLFGHMLTNCKEDWNY